MNQQLYYNKRLKLQNPSLLPTKSNSKCAHSSSAEKGRKKNTKMMKKKEKEKRVTNFTAVTVLLLKH